MWMVENNRKIEITVNKVDSIPCSLVGSKMVFNKEGTLISEPWHYPWPMPWIEEVFRAYALQHISASQVTTDRLYNPEEPDQYLEISARSYIDLTLGQTLDQVAEIFPDREALVNSTGSRRFLYRDFKKCSSQLAKGLLEIGIQKGDKVAVWAVNSPEFVMTQFGIGKVGAVMVPLNAHEKQLKIEALLRHSEATTIIMQVGPKATENIEILYKMCPELCESMPGKLKSEKLPKLKNVIVLSDVDYPGTFQWSSVLESGNQLPDDALKKREDSLNIDDVTFIIYTSGTTGTPKGVMLSHGNIVENANAMARLMSLTEKDVTCVQAPMFHCFGCVAGTLTSVISGASMVMVDKFKPEITLSLIEREKCTVVSGVPTMFIAFINEVRRAEYHIDSIRTGIVAGAPCTKSMIKDIKEVLKIKDIIVAYGLTEASPCVTAVCACDSFETKSATVGKPIPGVQVKTVDLKTGEETQPGLPGEIMVKGYNIMQGYCMMPDETKKTIDTDGWLRTGDVGILHPNGYLSISDRSKDIIIRAGENISPKEIEDYLSSHKDIAEVSVVGVPNYIVGEEIMAFIKVKEGKKLTEAEVLSYCKGRLATNKIPKYIAFVEEFPLSGSGKILKTALRKTALDIIGYEKES